MSAERRVVKNAAWVVLQPLLMNLLSLAATGYIARQLGSTEFGRFNLAFAFVAMLAPLTSLGLRPMVIRHVAVHRETANEYLGKVLVLRLLLALGTVGLITLASPHSGGSGDTRTVILIAAVAMLFTTVVQVFTDGLQGFELMRPSSVATMWGGVLLTLASVAVIYCGGGIRHMALAYVLGPFVSVALLCLWSRRLPVCPRLSWDAQAFVQLLRQAAPFFAIVLLTMLSTRLDVLILARMLGEAHLGSYTAATGLVDRAMVLADGAGTALLPALANLSAQTPISAVPLLRKSALWLLLVTLPIALITTALSPLAVSLLFGSQYAAAAPILAVGIWRLPAVSLEMLSCHSMYSVGRENLVVRTEGISMVVAVLLVFPLLHYFGPVGGAIALITRFLVAFLLRIPAMMHYFPGVWPWDQWARVAAALILMATPLAFVPSAGRNLSVVWLVVASTSIYAASLMTLRVIPGQQLVQLLRARLSGP